MLVYVPSSTCVDWRKKRKHRRGLLDRLDDLPSLTGNVRTVAIWLAVAAILLPTQL
ncbi:hypothetical protein [Tranquillimonas alkanivorans]|uniref:Uncharacterized protein n=1 Tax=Tranquillimonas alkanivorans TaxID=441119 RepID=A0A1I5SBS8_9RHOB|nr:hypothetical protein [Tranquillimonas alkanivorans]SFP67987.1 hypothetical protein SAMN04488047_110139 [Tranquillimonas alkanivorans]